MTRISLAAVVALIALPLTAFAQASSACRPADSTSTRMVKWVTNVVTGTDSGSVRQRTQMKLPQVAPTEISYVSDKTVCSKALSPYNANSGMQNGGVTVAPSGKLYVIKVGTVYVVNDPVKSWGNFLVYVTLDSRFRLLARSLG
jgi:hypothetical protein